MKTTLEIPDAIFRQAKSAATRRGIPLSLLVLEALAEKLRLEPASADAKPWMKSFGKLRHLQTETARINRILDEEFEETESECQE